MKGLFNSIRWRLQLWHGLILILVLSGFGATAYQLQKANDLGRIDDELESRLGALMGDLQGRRGPPGGPGGGPGGRRPPGEFGVPGEARTGDEIDFERPRGPRARAGFREGEGAGDGDLEVGPEGPGPRGGLPGPREVRLRDTTLRLFDEFAVTPYYFVMMRRDGEVFKASEKSPTGLIRPERIEGSNSVGNRMRGNFREVYRFTPPGDCILVGRSLEPEIARWKRFALWLAGAGSGVLAFGLAGGFWLATRAIKPIEAISATANRISAGRLNERIDVEDTETELGRLAATLNTTFRRLEDTFNQQAQFTADASHELRTPVTVILSQTQTALARERSADDYKETLEACQRAAQRMRKLIEALLELARLDAAQEAMRNEPFDLAAVARDCVDLIKPLAAERGVTIAADVLPTQVKGDAERIGQVVTNLLSNAVAYNREGGKVDLTIAAEKDHAVLSVIDTGIGIAAVDLPHVFDRFYRADKSRTRARGRTGLGLAIAKAIVEANGGVITVRSVLGEGTTFEVRLPRT